MSSNTGRSRLRGELAPMMVRVDDATRARWLTACNDGETLSAFVREACDELAARRLAGDDERAVVAVVRQLEGRGLGVLARAVHIAVAPSPPSHDEVARVVVALVELLRR